MVAFAGVYVLASVLFVPALLLTMGAGLAWGVVVGTPLVAVFGSTDWNETAPVSERARVVREETECAPCRLRECPIDHRCMRRVTVDRVAEAALDLMEAPASA